MYVCVCREIERMCVCRKIYRESLYVERERGGCVCREIDGVCM